MSLERFPELCEYWRVLSYLILTLEMTGLKLHLHNHVVVHPTLSVPVFILS